MKISRRAPEPQVASAISGLCEIAALLPAAADAFTAEEMEDRIARYAALIEAGQPLPLFGKEQPTDPNPIRRFLDTSCWACGRVCSRKDANEEGWVSRRDKHGGRDYHLTEIYCPECFAMWGWPDEFAEDAFAYGNNLFSYGCASPAGEAGK